MGIEDRLLPEVTQDIGAFIQNEMRFDSDYESKVFQKMLSDNQYVAQFIKFFSSKQKDSEDVLSMGILVYDLLDKSGKIPKVEIETFLSFVSELESDRYLQRLISHIKEENPQVINFIVTFPIDYSVHLPLLYGGLTVYRLLEHQSIKECMGDIPLQ